MNLFKYIVVLVLSTSLFLSCTNSNPKILIQTELGNITIELYPQKAPITVSNFLKYIKENRLEDATFYRTVTTDNQPNNDIKIEVIQGGLYEDEHPQMLPPIQHETTETTGILHKDGIISMARNEPGTATSEFFICVGDQPSLDSGGNRNSDGQGFAAFGKVIKGMDVVQKIHQSQAQGQWLKPRIKIAAIELLK
jgi:peptidyl-prolyl cis-trans isomerase A (cyclophilin A)